MVLQKQSTVSVLGSTQTPH